MSSWQSKSKNSAVYLTKVNVKPVPSQMIGHKFASKHWAGSTYIHHCYWLIIITQPKNWYSFYHATDGRKLSRLRHCSNTVQPMSKALYLRCLFFTINTTIHHRPASYKLIGRVTTRPLQQETELLKLYLVRYKTINIYRTMQALTYLDSKANYKHDYY